MEVWKDVVGYEGLYQVSNYGNIKNSKNIIMKQQTTKDGYFSVALSKNNKQKRYQAHRIVAIAFIDNKCQYPEINHKDENKKNNYVSNLEWCTKEYNRYYGTGQARNNTKKLKPVNQIKDGHIVKWYDSAKSAEIKTGINKQHIGDCCRGKRKTAGGYNWRFA